VIGSTCCVVVVEAGPAFESEMIGQFSILVARVIFA
jgi:hypothetical protein